jgi:hypothetical protein
MFYRCIITGIIHGLPSHKQMFYLIQKEAYFASELPTILLSALLLSL